MSFIFSSLFAILAASPFYFRYDTDKVKNYLFFHESGAMMYDIFIRYLHFIAIMLIMATAVAQHLLLQAELSLQQLKRLMLIDRIHLVLLVLVFIVGMLLFGNAKTFYAKNLFFHGKLTLFLVLLALSVFSSVVLLRIKHHLQRVNEKKWQMPRYLIMLVRVELLLLLMMPLLASLMVRGVGLSM